MIDPTLLQELRLARALRQAAAASPAPALPETLRAARDEIHDFIPPANPLKTHLDGFRAVLRAHELWDQVTPWIPPSRHIGRTEINALSRACAAGQADWVTLLALAMIWSAGETSENNGRARLLLALQTPDREAILAACAQQTRQGDLEGGLRQARLLGGIGLCNATKLVFAVGMSMPQPPRPLPVDQWVAASLIRLLPPNVARKRYDIAALRNSALKMLKRAGTYMTYCADMAAWSAELGCEADQLEMFLAAKGREQGAGAMEA